MSDSTWNFPLKSDRRRNLPDPLVSPVLCHPAPRYPRERVHRTRDTPKPSVASVLSARWISPRNPPDKSPARSIKAIVRRSMWPNGHALIRYERNYLRDISRTRSGPHSASRRENFSEIISRAAHSTAHSIYAPYSAYSRTNPGPVSTFKPKLPATACEKPAGLSASKRPVMVVVAIAASSMTMRVSE